MKDGSDRRGDAELTRRGFVRRVVGAAAAGVTLNEGAALRAAQAQTRTDGPPPAAAVPAGEPIVLTQVRLRGKAGLWNVGVVNGRIGQITQAPIAGAQTIVGDGKLLTEGLVEHHIHLDKVLTTDRYKWDEASLEADRQTWQKQYEAGELLRGFTVWRENQVRATYTEEDVFTRALKVVKMESANGTTSMRTHCVVDAVRDLHSLRGLLRLRDTIRPYMDLQISLHPQDGLLLRNVGEPELIRRGLALGADGIGGIPDVEPRRADDYIDLVFQIAKETGKFVDIHDQARDIPFPPPIMVAKTRKYGLQGQVTVSHGFSLGRRPQEKVLEPLFEDMKRENIALACAPTGTLDERIRWPRRQGVRVSLITDNVGDPWNRGVRADLVADATDYIGKLGIRSDEGLEGVFDMITTCPAESLGLKEHGMREGARADLVLWNAESVPQAMADGAVRLMVFKGGRLVAQAGRPLW